jgi:hypothetical protein
MATIGPGCSSDVADVGSAAARSARGYYNDMVFMSAMSTAPSLSNETSFPHVARLSTSDSNIQVAMTKIVTHFGWSRVVVVHDGTTWGREAAAEFISQFQQAVPDGTANTTTLDYSYSAFASGQLNVTDILHEIARWRGRIIYLAVQPVMARALFVAFDSLTRAANYPWFASKADFAWLLAWVDAQIFLNPVSVRTLARDGEGQCASD